MIAAYETRARCLQLSQEYRAKALVRVNTRMTLPPDVLECARKFEEWVNRAPSKREERLAALDVAVKMPKMQIDELLAEAKAYVYFIARPKTERVETSESGGDGNETNS